MGFIALVLGWLTIRNGALPGAFEGLKRVLLQERRSPAAQSPEELAAYPEDSSTTNGPQPNQRPPLRSEFSP